MTSIQIKKVGVFEGVAPIYLILPKHALKGLLAFCQRNRPPVRANQYGTYDVFQVIPTISRTGFIRVTAEKFYRCKPALGCFQTFTALGQ